MTQEGSSSIEAYYQDSIERNRQLKCQLEAKDQIIAELVEAVTALVRANDGVADYSLLPMEVEARKLGKAALSKAKTLEER